MERITDAPSVPLVEGDENWLAGLVGDTLWRGTNTATNEVDWYRFDLPQGDHYAVWLDLFAQRLGSELDGALSLFDADGDLIASNDDALAPEFPPDAALHVGLDGGTYFVAVSAGGNLPDEPDGFDPRVPGSGHASRGSTGQYLLRMAYQSDSVRPQVLGLSFEPGQTFEQPPTRITVRFSEAMDLHGLETGASLTNGTGDQIGLAAIGYDTELHEVTYLLLDRPVAGDYQFSLDPDTVTDLADNPLDAGPGAFAAEFHVDTADIQWSDAESNDTSDTAQVLGVLYPNELSATVRVTGSLGVDSDYYRFEVVLPGLYAIRLEAGAESSEIAGQISVHDSSGNVIAQATSDSGGATIYQMLQPGEYLIQVAGSGEQAAAESYQITIKSLGMSEVAPLADTQPGPGIQVVLRVSVSAGSTEVIDPAASSEESAATSNADETVNAAVAALPSVASLPIGRPRAEEADATALAWVDQSGGAGLPAGFVLAGQSGSSSPHFSVDAVSGTFSDALPDTLPDGTYALNMSSGGFAELARLIGRRGTGEAASANHSDADSAAGDGESGDGLDFGSGDDAPAPAQLAMDSPVLSFGVVFGLGAACTMTVPNRRRNTDWARRLMEFLGVG